MNPETRLTELGIDLPAPPEPKGAYVPWRVHGGVVYISGMLPLHDGKVIYTGVVGCDVDAERGKAAARWCAVNALSALRAAAGGDLNSVAAILRLNGAVASAPGFTAQPSVLNGASELLLEVFGPAGQHTRTAIGAAVLPLNAPVIIDLIAALK